MEDYVAGNCTGFESPPEGPPHRAVWRAAYRTVNTVQCTVYIYIIHYTVINIYRLCKAACTKLYIYIFKYGKQDFLLAYSDTVYWILIIFLVQCMYVLRTKGGRTFCAKNKVIFHQQMCWSIVVFTNKRSQAKVYTMYFGISSI